SAAPLRQARRGGKGRDKRRFRVTPLRTNPQIVVAKTRQRQRGSYHWLQSDRASCAGHICPTHRRRSRTRQEPEMTTTFPHLLQRHAADRPTATALREKEYGIWQTWSWQEAAAEVRHMACGLLSLGFQRG